MWCDAKLKYVQEVGNWSSLNLVGDEIFASQIVMEGLIRPFQELFNNYDIKYWC